MRVGNEIGAGHRKAAAFSVVVVNSVSLVVAVIEAIVVLSQRHVISYVFTGGERVADAVSDLCPFLAVTLVLNGLQPVLSGTIIVFALLFPSHSDLYFLLGCHTNNFSILQ